MIEIAIIDDQNLMREGLKVILSQYDDIHVVALGKDGFDAIDICRKYPIDVLLMDIRMPNLNGVMAVKEIRKFNSETKIILLTTFDDEDYIIEGISYGASGYLFKDIEYDKLVSNIRDVYSGQYVMPAKVAQVLANKLMNQEKRKNEMKNYNITARELEIIDLIREGFSNKHIASVLYISEGTVKNYISSIYSKTNMNDRESLIEFIKNKLY
ncbi:response regulator transcription factor [Mycoplasmatota bacterium]|nr:response regulator transcription factor [Mycoplasmatota bacterium]